MTRRDFLLAMAAAAPGQLMTVRGPVAASRLGLFLPHEHLFSLFGGDAAERPAYDVDKLLSAVVPAVESCGAQVIADATTAWFGRHPTLLRDISVKTGVHVLTNTGYYGAANDRYVPPHARTETADRIARRWIAEWTDGIEGTGIRPGFIKLGVDPGPLSDIDRKLVTAGARAHLATGLTLAVHTGDNPGAAVEQLAILRSEGVSPQAWIWVHAHNVKDAAPLLDAAREGAWISLDGLDESNTQRHLELFQTLDRAGLSTRVLLSHDGNSFRYGGRPPKGYGVLAKMFIPMMRAAGVPQSRITQVTEGNPATAFTVGVRKR